MNVQNKEKLLRVAKQQQQAMCKRTPRGLSTEILKVRGLGKTYFKFQKATTSNADDSTQGNDLSRFKDN